MDSLHKLPINATAVNVIKKGIHFEEEDNFKGIYSENSLPIRKKYQNILKKNNADDLTDIEFGRLKVIGLYDSKLEKYGNINVQLSNKGGVEFIGKSIIKKQITTWVVRCSCGIFETRKTWTIKKNSALKNSSDCCHICAKKRNARIVSLEEIKGKIERCIDFLKKYGYEVIKT